MSAPVVIVGLGGLAGAMALATAALVKFAARARSQREAVLAVFLLSMMAEMLGASVPYALAPSVTTLVESLAVSGALMAATAGAVVVALSSPSAGARSAAPPAPWRRGGFVAGAIALVLVNEGLMAFVFGLAAGTGPTGAPAGAMAGATALAQVLLSPWFVFSMGAEMAAATALLWRGLPGALRVLLPVQAAIMVLSPPTLGVAGWSTFAVVAGSGAMIGLLVYQMEYLYRHRALVPALSAYLAALLATYSGMMAGLFLWLAYGTPVVLGVSIAAEMVVYFAAVFQLDRFGEPAGAPWGERPRWTFAVLSTIFVAEFFMGAALDLVLEPSVYVGSFPSLPLAGSAVTVLTHATSNGFWFLADVSASTWFLTMMGLEMGALVVFKMRESRHVEQRIRLGLMIGCYFAFAVFYPSLYFGLYDPGAPAASTVPVLGWSMGIGSYPLAAVVFPALLATYAITGVLVAMFGRRVVCSVFCTAPLMYQGTTIDAMKSFNRSEPLARKYLSSRISGLYGVTTGVVMGSLALTSVLSYLDTTGRLSVYVGGADPSVFLFTLYFSVLWYLFFVTIPFTGNYNCVTMGWCYTGTIAQAFQKIGFFELKVRSRETCKACTTIDCAKGCPVGLVDMPGHFRSTGRFRSTKCCGVGDCVEACPYDNLYVADFRHWVRRRLGRPEVGPPRHARLPMVGAAPRPAVLSAAAARDTSAAGPRPSGAPADAPGRRPTPAPTVI